MSGSGLKAAQLCGLVVSVSLLFTAMGCRDEEVPPSCGDGAVTAPETCDDGNTVSGDGCSATCVVEAAPACGDGNLTAPEECDDGNRVSGDGCSATCTREFDRCDPNPCLNGGTCADGACQCPAGFSGATCETNIDECAPNPCLNGGTCTDGVNAFTCACAAGFSGSTCATNIDECAAMPCLNGGTCTDGVNAFTCACAAGFTGTTCDTNINECAPNPCLNGGTCTDGINAFTCACTANFTGPTCNACPGSLANCNGTATDGCETNLQSSAQHCGACGSPCTSGNICVGAACQQPPVVVMPGVPLSVDAGYGPMAPAIADLDRDGDLDVLVANAESGSTTTPSGSISVFSGNGNGTLQPEVRYAGAPMSSNAVVAVDIDGDGWLDAVTVDGQINLPAANGSISVFRNLGASAPGTFGSLANYSTGAPGSVHLCTGDFNRDGRADLATVSVISNQVSVLLANTTGGFAAPVLISIQATGGVQSSIGCRDLNGDGASDLVVTSPSSARVSVLLNQGSGTFAAPVSYTNTMNGQTAGVAFGDADGDGRLDILSNGAAGRYMFFFKGNGDGTFANGAHSNVGPNAVANSALGLVVGDYTGDGRLDAYVLITTSSGGVRPMTGAGTGSFTSGNFVATGALPGLNAIATADLNGDGYLDLVLTNRSSGTVTVVPNGL